MPRALSFLEIRLWGKGGRCFSGRFEEIRGAFVGEGEKGFLGVVVASELETRITASSYSAESHMLTIAIPGEFLRIRVHTLPRP